LKAASSRLGAAVAPYLVVTMLRFTSWRGVFAVFGSIGFLWAAAFYFWFRDRPSQHPSINPAELAIVPPEEEDRGHVAAPWRRLLGSASLWLLSLQWFFHFYSFYFYITWLPTYLQNVRGVEVNRSALLAGLPVLTAALGSLAGGWILAHVIRRLGDVGRSRKLVAYYSYIAAAVLMLLAIRPASAELAVFLMSLSSFAAEISGPLTWTTAMDLGGRHVGAASGAMNSLGQLGGAVAPAIVGYFAQLGPQGWTAALYSAAAAYALGFLCWLFLDPVTPLDRPVPSAASIPAIG
jgi:nitrate/nitrite transporter NarK